MQLFYVPHLCGTACFQDPPVVSLAHYGVDEEGPPPASADTTEAVVVDPPQLPLSNEQMNFIRQMFHPLNDDNNFGIDNYVHLLNFVTILLQYQNCR